MSNFLYRLYIIVRWLCQSIGIMHWIESSTLAIRAARWTREHITGGGVVVVTEKIDGHQMQINPDYIDLLRGQGYERGTTKVFTELVKEGMNVVDIGANIGYYTLLAARRVGLHCRVYAFEPEPYNFKILTENIRLNGYNNVIAIQKAVSNESGTAPLFLSPRGDGWHGLLSPKDYSKEAIAVKTVTLDEFFETEGCPAIQVVKMDIEGWEIEALDGMHRFIIRNNPLAMIVEFTPRLLLTRDMSPLALMDKLMELGFTISVIDEDSGQTAPFAEYHSGKPSEFVTKHRTSVNLLAQK